MAQILVRNLEDAVKDGLRRRAEQHGRSVEAEAREILTDAVANGGEAASLSQRIRSRFAGAGLEEAIEEWRGQEVRPIGLPE